MKSKLFTLCFFSFFLLAACSPSEQQQVHRPDEEQQQVVVLPGGEQQVVELPNESEGEQQVVVGSDGLEQAPPSDLAEDILFSLQFQINPSFEIQVGLDERVVALIPHNSDGQLVCNGLEVIGMPYQDAVYALIDTSARRGFLESGDMIDIIMTFRAASEQTMFGYDMEIHGIIAQYAQSHQLSDLQFSGGYGSQNFVENEDPQWSPENDPQSSGHPGHASNQEILETDAHGNVLRYIERHDDHTREFFLDADGRELKTILTIFDGTVITVTYHPNGTIAKEINVDPNGNQHISVYDSNGMIVSSEDHTADGYHTQITHYPNGKHATAITTGPDDFYAERRYSEDGLTVTSIDPNGQMTIETFYEDGTLATRKVDYGESTVEDHYNQNGNLTLSISIGKDGRRTETYWNPDKSGSMTQYGLDGSSSTVYFRPDGKVTHGYDSNGNYYEETRDVYAGTKNGGKG